MFVKLFLNSRFTLENFLRDFLKNIGVISLPKEVFLLCKL